MIKIHSYKIINNYLTEIIDIIAIDSDFDIIRYPVVKYAEKVIKNKGGYGAVFNASNEVAVNYFLKGKIKFLDIEKIIRILMKNHENILNPTYEQLYKVDKITREQTLNLIERKMVK